MSAGQEELYAVYLQPTVVINEHPVCFSDRNTKCLQTYGDDFTSIVNLKCVARSVARRSSCCY